MRTRNWSIRSKITALVAVPLVALLALWIFATALTVGPAFNLLSARTLLDDVGRPGEALVAELQQERRLSVVHLARRGNERELAAQRTATDRAVSTFRAAATAPRTSDVADALLRTRISQVLTAVEGLPAGRGYIDRREVDRSGAQNLYSSIVDGIFRMFSATASYGDAEIDRQTRALATIGRAREWLSRADSLLAGANAAGAFAGDEHGRLAQAIGTQEYLYAEAVADLPQADRVAYQRLTGGDAFVRLRAMQNTLVQSSGPGGSPPVRGDDWQPAYDSVVQQLRAFELNATDSLADRARPVALGILGRLTAVGLLGLVAVMVSLMVSMRVGRSLIGRLAGLRAALDASGEQLPTLVRRLRRGESVDVEAESPPVDYGSDEIGRVGRAFGQVRRVAVQSAVDEATVRRGLNEVFLNIARRSQTLLHRQLSLLDRMERRETEAQELEDLYRVDHLATRMRRHAEDLVILAGAAPGRGWRNPVPVVDVVRGAISEVEDYKRIDVSGVETASLVGRAVGDVIHLLAELLENATSFSPPNTRVQVAGQVVPNGYAVEIEDRGLGMTPEALAEVNHRLSEPPEFDPSDSARLGLFVVSRLASRHRIRVQLRPSPYGGVTAVTLIPGDLVTVGTEQAALPAGPAAADRSWDRPPVDAAVTPGQRSAPSSPDPTPPAVPLQAMPAAMPGRRPVSAQPTPAQAQPTPAQQGPAQPTPAQAVSGRPVAAGRRNGWRGAEPDDGDDASAPPAVARRPAGISEVDGVTSEGLARRRRTVPRPRLPLADDDAPTLTQLPLVAPGEPLAVPLSGAHPPRGRPAADQPVGGQPVAGRPVAGQPVAGQPVGNWPAGGVSGGEEELPRRVRQANLNPQLRTTGEPEREPASRSPEEVRRLMSALQRGTARGRLAAAGRPYRSADDDRSGAPAGGAEVGARARHAQRPDRPAGYPADGSVGYPGTRDPAGAATDAATVVHYGEIVPRRAADATARPPSSPVTLPDVPRPGDSIPPEKDA